MAEEEAEAERIDILYNFKTKVPHLWRRRNRKAVLRVVNISIICSYVNTSILVLMISKFVGHKNKLKLVELFCHITK